MHDCSQTQERLIDLVFDEIGPDQKRNLLAEVSRCQACNAHYRSMARTLDVFDQATEAAQPAENYWLAYDMKLRTRLIETNKPSLWTRIYESFTSFKIGGWVPVPVAAAIVLAVIAVGVIWSLNGHKSIQNVNPPVIATTDPGPKPSPVPQENPKTKGVEDKHLVAKVPKSNSSVPKTKVGSVKPNVESIPDPTADIIVAANPPYSAPSYDLIDSGTVKHLEKAQVLLRSFRNTRVGDHNGVFDLAYEKQQSRRLLNQNIVLRRSAEAKGNLPTEELLSSLEPFLIDIANLPDKPAEDDIHSIKQRMQKREIVASLQIYSARTAPPSY